MFITSYPIHILTGRVIVAKLSMIKPVSVFLL